MARTFNDRIALVSGASRGLGFALAERLGREGAHVIALARTVGGLEELDDRIQAAGGQATLVPLDLGDDPALERLGAAVHERWGRLDLWLHTAVQAPPFQPVEHIDAKELDRSLATNMRAVQRLVRVLDPLLRQAPAGRAVFFDDPDAAGRAFGAAYHAAKLGQAELVRAWGQGLSAVSHVKVVSEAPPPMRTALRARFYPGEDVSALADPGDVASGVLARLAASF